MNKMYEYYVEKYNTVIENYNNYIDKKINDELTEYLNSMGKRGWEVVAIRDCDAGFEYLQITFKREINESNSNKGKSDFDDLINEKEVLAEIPYLGDCLKMEKQLKNLLKKNEITQEEYKIMERHI